MYGNASSSTSALEMRSRIDYDLRFTIYDLFSSRGARWFFCDDEQERACQLVWLTVVRAIQIRDGQAHLLQQAAYFSDSIDPMPPLSHLGSAVAHEGRCRLQTTEVGILEPVGAGGHSFILVARTHETVSFGDEVVHVKSKFFRKQ